MLRQIMTPNKTNITLDLPEEFLGKEIEILVFPIPSQMDTTEYLLSNQANAQHLYQALQDLENPSCYKYVDLAELEKI